MKKLLVCAALIALAGPAGPAVAQEGMKVVKSDTLKWQPHPIFKGAEIMILIGDSKKAETIVQRVKFPPNYQVPPHTHPYAEVVTVMSGTFHNGMGEKVDKSKGDTLKAGSIFSMPAKHAHYVWTGNEEAIVQIQYIGPGGIEFINPADDPRKK